MFEKKWALVGPVVFTAVGTTDGDATITSSEGFKVKMSVSLRAPFLPALRLEVKRVTSPIMIELGPVGGRITDRADISAYPIGSILLAAEQDRPSIPLNEISRWTYEEEPTVALRTVSVDPFGKIVGTLLNPYSVTGSELNLIANILAMQLLGLPTDPYIVNNDGFFVTSNDGSLIKSG